MARDLERMRDTLWKAFDDAAERHESYYDHSHELKYNPRIANRTALAQLAQAILLVEAKIEERQEKDNTFKKGLG